MSTHKPETTIQSHLSAASLRRFVGIGLFGLLGSNLLVACANTNPNEQDLIVDGEEAMTDEASSALLRCGFGCPQGEHAEAIDVVDPACLQTGTLCMPNTNTFWHCSATTCPAGWHMEARRCDSACGTCPNGFNSSYCVANADVTFDQCISTQSCPWTGYRTINSICVADSPCGPCRYGYPNEQTCEKVQ